MFIKLKTALFFLILTSWLILFPYSIEAFSGGGAGSSVSPYQITNCSQLQEMTNAKSAYYQIQNDIDCSGFTYTSVGSSGSTFTGNLNGQNYAISNLSISGTSRVGLFGETAGATIQNVRITSGNITASSGLVGSLVGFASGGVTITHSSSQASVNGAGSIGGLVGASSAGGTTIDKSFYSGTLVSTSGYTGGIIGNIYGGTNSITNSYSAGSLTLSSSAYFGGIAGAMNDSTTIDNTYTSATLVTTGSSYSGGLVGGFFNGTVTDSFSAATITGSGTNKGAVFGRGEGTASGLSADVYLAGTSTCSASGSATCTARNSGNSDPNFFKNNSSNAPMSGWDFSSIWQTVSADYPSLVGFSSPPAPIPIPLTIPSSSVSAPSCSNTAPSSQPDLFRIDHNGSSVSLNFTTVPGASGYEVNYGLNQSADQYGDSFNYSGSQWIITRQISQLAPRTTYYFRIRAINGCNAGGWSQVVSVQTTGKTITLPGQNSSVLGVSTINDCHYQVQAGDSLWRIAQQKWGSGIRYQEIIDLNPTLTSNLNIGQTIQFCR